MCEEKDLLVSFLYDDVGDADRARFEHHLRRCAECRDELHALQGVRADLTAWAPPASELGFRIVQDPKVVALTPRRAEWRGWWTPAAGLAAAAVLVLAAASAIAHVEIHRGPDGVTVRTGWNSAPAATVAAAAPAATAVQPVAAMSMEPRRGADEAATLAAIEARLRALESSHDSAVRAASALSARASDAELIRRVRDMLTVSESKEHAEMALRVAQLNRDFDAQRTADLQRIQSSFARMNANFD